MTSFNLRDIFRELIKSGDSRTKEILEDYLSNGGKMVDTIEELPFFDGYLSWFEVIPYSVPEEFKNLFDWDFLLRLAAASYSTHIDFRLNSDGSTELGIFVIKKNSSKKVSTLISQLDCEQILELFKVLLTEQITFHNESHTGLKDSREKHERIYKYKWLLNNHKSQIKVQQIMNKFYSK